MHNHYLSKADGLSESDLLHIIKHQYVMIPTEREYGNPTLFAHEFQKVVLLSIICFVKVVLLTERGYEYEVSGDVWQSS